MFPLITLLLLSSPVRPICAPSTSQEVCAPRASYLITTTDDFIIEVYQNGKAVPITKRTMLEERFGATVERIDVDVHQGDWLVFNVVNNRMRWGGACYFAVAGCFARDEFGFVSDAASKQWSACDNPRDAGKFIAHKTFFSDKPAKAIEHPWSDGDPLMRQYAGPTWKGTPVWGGSRNTWIKVIVP